MDTRWQKMFFSYLTPKLLVVIGGTMQLLSAALLLIDTHSELWDEQRLIAFCVIGAVLGAFLTISIYPSQAKGLQGGRLVLMKFASSLICGVVFAPIILRLRNWPLDPTTILAVSVTAAFLGVSSLHFATAWWQKWMHKKAENIFGSSNKDNE